jgi:hypothetical protein
MNVGTRKTLVSFVLMLLARTAGAEGSGAPPWQESFTARLGALALLQTLNAELLSHDSAYTDPRPLVCRPPVGPAEAWIAEHQRRFQSFGRPVPRHPESLPLVPAATLGWPSRQPRCRNH